MAAAALIIQEMEEKEADSPARSLVHPLSLDRFSFEHDPTSPGSLLAPPFFRSRRMKRDRPSHCQNAAAIAGYAFGFSDGKLNEELDR